MKVLFVCKWNRFRSKAAEAIFNKLYKDKGHMAKSAGIFSQFNISQEALDSIDKTQKAIKINFSKKQRQISEELVKWCDVIIIVADNVPSFIFEDIKKECKKKIIYWKVRDVYDKSVEKRIQLINEIGGRIKKLNLT